LPGGSLLPNFRPIWDCLVIQFLRCKSQVRCLHKASQRSLRVGQMAGLPGVHALPDSGTGGMDNPVKLDDPIRCASGTSVVAVECFLAQSHCQNGLLRGFGLPPFRERVHVPPAAGALTGRCADAGR
jgi:hypothetical protein